MSYIYKTMNVSSFRDAFKQCGRGEQFSFQGLGALYVYLKQLACDTETPIELDVIALCCEYAEYESLAEFQKEHGAKVFMTLDDIRDATTVIEIADESFIVQQF